MSDTILLRRDGAVATITLNRPARLNAFADDMRERLRDALDAVNRDADARVLAITGAGRAFCAGGDVAHMARLEARAASFDEVRPLLDLGRDVIVRLASLPIPTLAVVNGVAAGAGLNLALACDLRIASDQARFGETFARIGLHPDWGGTYHLARLVGLARALELCWLGDTIDAPEALRSGLVNRVVPHEALQREAQALARRLADAPATSVRLVKRTLRAALHRSLDECLDAEAAAQETCWGTADVSEGLRAFVEKREPVFGGAGAGGAADAPGEAPSRAARLFE